MTDLHFLTNGFGDNYLYAVNRNSFNKIGSDAVFHRHFGESLWSEDTLFFIVGSDSGLLIRYISKHTPAEGSCFIFIEPPPLIPLLRRQLADIGLEGPFFIAAPDDWMTLSKEIQFKQYAVLENIRVLQSVGATDGFWFDYRRIYLETRTAVQDFLWKTEFTLGGQAFAKRQLENLVESDTPAAQLRNAFAGHTAVLLGGGPSLDEAIPWIVANRDRLVVIAVSRVCRRLLQIPVTPDIIVSIDPTDLSFDISKEMLRLDRGPLFVHANHVNFPLLSQWAGASAYLNYLLPWNSKLKQPNVLTAPPTVTNTALNLAVELGFSRLLLTGVDLCHDREGYSHAKGSNEHDTGPLLDTPGFTVETNGGWQANTTPDFYNAISAMSLQAEKAAQAGCELINLSAGAAKIDGIGFRPADALQLEPCASPPRQVLERLLAPGTGESRVQHIEALRKELLHGIKRLGEIKKLAQQALRFNEGLFGRRSRPADFKYKKRMDRIEHRLDTAYKDISPLVRTFSAREFLRVPPTDREWSDAEIEQAGKTYYEAYANSAQRLIDLFRGARDRLEITLEEEHPEPDFGRLTAQWKKDAIPGRARVWRLRHPDVAERLDDATKAQLDQLEAQFEEILDSKQTLHAKRCQELVALGPMRGKLLLLFNEKKPQDLKELADKLQNFEGSEADELKALARGYMTELDGDPVRAFEHYAMLIESAQTEIERHTEEQKHYFNPRLEDALRRMIFIALANRDRRTALLLMDSLATMSPPHEPQYAEMLRLSGDVQKAIDVYTDYLTKAPDDLAAMMKLGTLFQGIGADDAAREAFRYVTGRDPHNQAAQTLLNDLEQSP